MCLCSAIILMEIKKKSQGQSTGIIERSKVRNRQLLLMLTLTNIYFIMCSLPLFVNMILPQFKIFKYQSHFYQMLFQIIFYTNNVVNFFFYMGFAQRYRQTFLLVFYNKKLDTRNAGATEYPLTNIRTTTGAGFRPVNPSDCQTTSLFQTSTLSRPRIIFKVNRLCSIKSLSQRLDDKPFQNDETYNNSNESSFHSFNSGDISQDQFGIFKVKDEEITV
jgi:hypothetical protein